MLTKNIAFLGNNKNYLIISNTNCFDGRYTWVCLIINTAGSHLGMYASTAITFLSLAVATLVSTTV